MIREPFFEIAMNDTYLPINSWAEDERPREKMLQKGATSLSMNELFAVLLRSGVGGESALELSRRILADNRNDLNELAHRSVRELMNKYKGVGIAKAAAIVAAMEISRRRSSAEVKVNSVIRSSSEAFQYARSFLSDLDHEEFWVIYLANSSRVKGCECLSSGGMSGTVVDVRMLYRNALDVRATSVIIAHNHPGGAVQPSNEDKAITRKIAEAGAFLDIKLCDHLILGSNAYFSFADEGLL